LNLRWCRRAGAPAHFGLVKALGVDAALFGFDLQQDRVDLEVQHGSSSFRDLLFDGFDVLAQFSVEICCG
jgi:hypothetical protein